MAVSGQSVFDVLRRSYDQLSRVANSLDQRHTALEAKLRELLNQVDQAVTQLAKIYLPELTGPAIEGTFAEVRHELRAILSQQQQALREAHQQYDELRQRQEALRSELDGITVRLNEKVQQREKLAALVTQQLADDPEFQQLSADVARTEEQLTRDERRLKEVEHDALEKLPAYQSNRLFAYLRQRGYATPEYRAWGLFRRLDRWVAELIDFHHARRSFEFLSVTPRLMAGELKRRRIEFDALMKDVELHQSKAADAAGLTAVLDEGRALGAQRDKIVAELTQFGERIQAVEQRVVALSSEHNEFHQRAVARLREFLKRAETVVLEQRARQTRDTADDPIVAQVVAATRSIDDVQRELQALSDKRDAAVEKSSSLRSVLDRFQQSNFDAERSVFTDDLDADALVAAFVSDRLDGAALWRQLSNKQRFRPMQPQVAFPEGNLSPGAGMVLNAVLQAAGAALEHSARRGVERRWRQQSPGGSFPTISLPNLGGGGSFPSGGSWSGGGGGGSGFTTGDGF